MASSVDIAQLNIKITDNAEKASDKVLNLAQALETLRNSAKDTGLKLVSSELSALKGTDMSGLSRLRTQLSKALAPAKQLATAMKDISKANAAINKGVAAASKATSKVQETIDGSVRASAPGSNYKGTTAGASPTTQISQKVQDTMNHIQLQDSLDKWIKEDDKIKIVSQRFERLNSAISNVGNTAKKVFGKIFPQGLSNTLSQLGRLMKMRILRTIVKNLLAGFTEGLQNTYYWAKATGDQFARSMDMISTSMAYAKNSIGAAFSSVLNIIAPIIDKIVDWLVTGINYINMFFAALSGATTYTKAKKNIVEYGTAAQGALGGAAGAAKELKEQLSVLDFDELNQLQAQPEPSSGGGGGGGGGTPATDYADMFEKANIDGWMLDNLQDILELIKTIGAGILAWKFSDAFLSGLSTLQKLGVAISVAGFVLEFQGAYDMGHDGITLKNVLKTAGGALAGILGGVFAFGASSLMITVPLAITLFLTGFIMGGVDAAKEKYKNDPAFKDIRDMLDESIRKLEEVREIRVRIKNIKIEYDEKMTNIETAQNLLDKLKIFNGIENPSESDLAEIERLIGALNSLNLDGVSAQFDLLNGKVQINIDELEDALDALRDMAEQAALFDLYVEQAKAEVALEQAVQRGQIDLATGRTKIAEYGQVIEDARNTPGAYVSRQWQPGDEVPAMQWSANPEVAFAMQGINDVLDTWANDTDAIYEAKAALDDVNELLEIFAEKVSDVGEATKLITLPYAPTVYEKANKELDRPILGSSRYDLQQQYEQLTGKGTNGGLNIFADPTKNALGFSQVATEAQNAAVQTENLDSAYGDIIDSGVELNVVSSKIDQNLTEVFGEMGNGATVVNDSTNRNKTYTGSLKLMGDESKKTSSTIVSALSGITKGVNMATMGQTMADNFIKPFNGLGSNVKSTIETDLNKIGNGMQYTTIMGNINTGLTNAQKSTPFANIGVSIGGNMQSGATSGFNSGTVMTSYKNGLTDKQKSGGFSSVGSLMGGDMQSGAYNGFSSAYIIAAYLSGLTDKQKNALFSGVGSAMGGDMQSGAWNGFSSKYIIGAYLQGLLDAEYNASFSSIGNAIGYDIKNGIAAAIQTINFSTTAAVAGVYRTISGYATTTLGYATGGYPQSGELFWANENGTPEMIGSVGGRTAVANNEQIASAIAKALQPMLSGGGTTTTNVSVNMDSRTVARASLKGQRAMNRQYNITANA